ncbi:unnamed protein product [Amoebophrya sp. A25]|nr:unnamed protein product [Amoebophrya sp. A25]|eukprot:GSA25T00016243001.1
MPEDQHNGASNVIGNVVASDGGADDAAALTTALQGLQLAESDCKSLLDYIAMSARVTNEKERKAMEKREEDAFEAMLVEDIARSIVLQEEARRDGKQAGPKPQPKKSSPTAANGTKASSTIAAASTSVASATSSKIASPPARVANTTSREPLASGTSGAVLPSCSRLDGGTKGVYLQDVKKSSGSTRLVRTGSMQSEDSAAAVEVNAFPRNLVEEDPFSAELEREMEAAIAADLDRQ